MIAWLRRHRVGIGVSLMAPFSVLAILDMVRGLLFGSYSDRLALGIVAAAFVLIAVPVVIDARRRTYGG